MVVATRKERAIITLYRRLDLTGRIALLERHPPPVSKAKFIIAALQWEKDPLAKWHLLKLAGTCSVPQAIKPTIEVLGAPDFNFANTSLHLIAAWSLGRIGQAALEPVLQAIHKADNEITVASLADALGEIGSPKGIAPLSYLFSNHSSRVKLFAALSLSKIGVPAIPALEELARATTSAQERLLLFDALVKLGSEAANEAIGAILRELSAEEARFFKARLPS